MSLILEMLHFNIPLSQWPTYIPRENGAGFFSAKNTDKIAGLIFRQMSHENTIQLLVKEFNSLPQQVRIQLRTLCSDGNASGNVRKGVQRLNTMMKGELLREETRPDRMRISTRSGFRYQDVRPEVAGATRKYGILNPGANKKK